MNLQKLKEILNNDEMPDEYKAYKVLEVIAKDDNSIPEMLKILSIERNKKKELITDMNLQLSRAHVGLEAGEFRKDGLNGNRFMEKEIVDFYRKYKDQVGHCFKNLYLD